VKDLLLPIFQGSTTLETWLVIHHDSPVTSSWMILQVFISWIIHYHLLGGLEHGWIMTFQKYWENYDPN